MSDFDANPFADPEAANPFSDPAVQQAAGTGAQRGMDEYNPFAAGNQTKTTNPANPQQPQQQWKPPPPQPAVMQPTESPPPPYTPSAAQKADTAELQRRQEELERKADELQRKEQQMRDAQINKDPRANNWPPLPEKCCVGPCFYQDFNVDIPLEFQRIVKILYYLWMFHVCVLFLNILGGLAYFIADSGSSSGGTTFGLSILYFVLFTPCSFVCWYRPVYKAFRSDSSFNFFLFFFIFFFQFIVHLIQCLGINGWGTCGWINGLSLVGPNPGAGAILLIIGLLYSLMAAADIILLIKVHRIYRSTGASFAKAQQEFAQGVMKNENVQNAAGNMAAGAARNAFAGTGSGGNRY